MGEAREVRKEHLEDAGAVHLGHEWGTGCARDESMTDQDNRSQIDQQAPSYPPYSL